MVTTSVTKAQPGDLFVDFATELTPRIAAALAAAGVKGVMQYTPYDNTNRFKYGSAREAQIAHDHGLYYMLNWEIESSRGLQGYAVGKSDGARNRAAVRAMGYPDEVSAPVSVDMNTVFGNITAVKGFVSGHWEADGDKCINMAYLDTDGGRALTDLDPCIWIPGALSWSPELFAVRNDRAELMRRAAANPQAYCIQFPSEDFQGLLRIDRNIVLKPFNVWCAPYSPSPPPPPPPAPPRTDVIAPPFDIPARPFKEDTLATARITVEGRNAQFYGTGTLMPDGSVHCVMVTWSGPGDRSFHQDHSAAADVVVQHYTPETLQRDLVLVGDPADIQDELHSWGPSDFFRVAA